MNEMTNLKRRYEMGLEKLDLAANQIVSMQSELNNLKPKLLTSSKRMELLMVKIEQNTITMESSKEIVAADEALANEAAAASQAIRDDCESDLSEAEPALKNAIIALDTLKPSDINVVKAMKNPPRLIKLVLEAICVIKDLKPEYRIIAESDTVIEDYWSTSLRLLNDSKFLDNLKKFNKDNIDPTAMKIIRERYLPLLDFKPNNVRKVSNACEGLCSWILAMEIYDRVIKIVRPKRSKLIDAEMEYTRQMERLNEKRAQLAQVMEKLQSLRDELAERSKKKKELEDSIHSCSQKLDRAEKLKRNFGREKLRWIQTVNHLQESICKAVGDMLLSSAIIIYLSNVSVREGIIRNWMMHYYNLNLPVTEDFSLVSTFYNVENTHLQLMNNLLVDDISIENAIILEKCQNVPLLIDPQGIALEYLKTNKNNMLILKEINENSTDIIKSAMTDGRYIIILTCLENLITYADMIPKRLFQNDMKKTFIFNGEIITTCEDFKICLLASSDINRYYDYAVFTKITLVNFTLTQVGIEKRLLKTITEEESSILGQERTVLLSEYGDTNFSVKETEDQILNVVCSKENILDDEVVLETISSLKLLLTESQRKQTDLLKAEYKLTKLQNKYERICGHVAKIYLCIYQVHNSVLTVNRFNQFLRQRIKNESFISEDTIKSGCFIKDMYEQVSSLLTDYKKVVLLYLFAIEAARLKIDLQNML